LPQIGDSPLGNTYIKLLCVHEGHVDNSEVVKSLSVSMSVPIFYGNPFEALQIVESL